MISTSVASPTHNAAAIGANVRRLMARDGLTYDDVVQASGLDERTLRGLVRGANNPHARTLHKLAHGLGVEIDELFRAPARSPRQEFDRATNSLVEATVAAHPELFANWTDADFDELYSRFGTGGALTEDGVLATVETTNARRAVWQQVAVILESGEASLLRELIDVLYRRATENKDWSH